VIEEKQQNYVKVSSVIEEKEHNYVKGKDPLPFEK
jgi:hypothetical protein